MLMLDLKELKKQREAELYKKLSPDVIKILENIKKNEQEIRR